MTSSEMLKPRSEYLLSTSAMRTTSRIRGVVGIHLVRFVVGRAFVRRVIGIRLVALVIGVRFLHLACGMSGSRIQSVFIAI